MDMRDLFLAQHSAVHTAAVGGNKVSAAERVLNGLSDEQMRVRPREDLNSIAWLVWHIARAEDIFLNPVLAGRDQVFDDAWMKRLGVTRKDFGIGMKSPEVSELTRAINLDALREYRDRWASARARSSAASSRKTGKARSSSRPWSAPPPRAPFRRRWCRPSRVGRGWRC